MGERLAGKTVWVTGGSRGIGRAIAEACAAEGAKVAISSRKQPGLDAAAAEINATHPEACLPIAAHAGDLDRLREVAQTIEERLGPVDVLVNNAATNPYFGPLIDTPGPAWDKTFQVNVRGYFETARLVARRMLEAKRGGSIINVASIQGQRASPLQGVYGMTKAAVISMTQTFAVELGPAGVRMNAIAPGLVETRFAGILTSTPEISKGYTERAALKRWGAPDEIAGLAVYLASDESSYLTGQVLTIDGGYTAT